MEDEMEMEKENHCENTFKGIMGLFNFVTLILLIVWLFKIINNCKTEPGNYADFISNETLQNSKLH